jgi:hypothetical protein
LCKFGRRLGEVEDPKFSDNRKVAGDKMMGRDEKGERRRKQNSIRLGLTVGLFVFIHPFGHNTVMTLAAATASLRRDIRVVLLF